MSRPRTDGGRRGVVVLTLLDSAAAENRRAAAGNPADTVCAPSQRVPGARSFRLGRSGAWFVGVLMALGACAAATAQTPAESRTTPLTPAALEARLKQVQSDASLGEALQGELAGLYRSAIAELQAAEQATQRAKEFRARLAGAADLLQQRRASLALLSDKPPAIAPDPALTLDQLEQLVDVEQQRIDDPESGLRQRLTEADEAVSRREERLTKIGGDIAAAEARLEALQKAAEIPAPADEPAAKTAARRALAQAQRQQVEQTLAALQAESAWAQSADVEALLRADREVLERRLALAAGELAQWQKLRDDRRQQAAAARAADAAADALRAHPTLRPLAERNRALAEEAKSVTFGLEELQRQIADARGQLDQLAEESHRTRDMVEAVGLTETIGLMLRRQRLQLDTLRRRHSRSAHRAEEIRDVRLKIFQLDERAAPPAAPAETATVPTPPADVSELRAEGERLETRREELIEELRDLYGRYFAALVDLDHAEQKLVREATAYGRFIDERALWVRTGSPLSAAQLRSAGRLVSELAAPATWAEVAAVFREDIPRRPVAYGFVAAALGVWWLLRRKLAQRLKRAGEQAAAAGPRTFWPTWEALWSTVCLAAGLPLFLAFLGWRLDDVVGGPAWRHTVSQGLWQAAVFLTPLQLLRWVCARHGLADNHYDWPDDTLLRVRRNLGWYIPLGGLLVGAVGAVAAGTDEVLRDAVGRLLFLALALATAVFCARVLTTPQGQPGWQETEVARVRRWVRVTRWIGVGVPLGLIVLDWWGYFHTALELSWRLEHTAWLAVGLLTLRSTVLRWITVEEHRMRELQNEQAPPAHIAAPREPGLPSVNPFLFPRFNWPDWAFDLSRVVEQMRGLLQIGLVTAAAAGAWGVWSDVVPALGILNQWPLWQTTVDQAVTSTDAAGQSTVSAGRQLRPVTAADLGLAILIVAVGWIAARNVPGLVEVILLERLPVDAGARFAVTSLVRYAIFVIAAVLACGQIGVNWSSVQWLVAAASVGLGFGLQEIFANFVSGVILLFERPIRMGDVITIGDTTGTVSKIRFRATTITDWDRKELIVPNKEFITGKLLNWTLSDQINRVVIKVGVAYGSDPQQVRELLLETARQQPLLLKAPAPTAVCDQLGDSALNFTLCCFLPNLEHRSKVIHELHTAIYERLNAAGIEIPFPQREVHVRTWPPAAATPPAAS